MSSGEHPAGSETGSGEPYSSLSDSGPSIAGGTIVLDKYQVERTVGIGGMGLVVSAIHTSLGTPVAIKFLLPQFASSAEATRRFLREAQAASKIASEHIVRVFDTGMSQPWGPYIVMEYLEGNDLSRRLRTGGPLSIELAIDFTVQAALALTEAHANGIVHRDVKPANLFVVQRSDGAPLLKVLDFGISKVAEASSLEVTRTQAILGSGLYMSPEQMRSSKGVDHRTDIYALGVTIFEMLTRTQPFTAESFAELAIKVSSEPPTPLLSLRPDIPIELSEAIARAYAKKPDDRYQSMGELALALMPWALPRTRELIDSLARTETLRGRAPSLPPAAMAMTGGVRNSSPSIFPAGTYGDIRIPLAPSIPTPSSVGVDTFGLSRRDPRTPDPLGQTAAAPGAPTTSKNGFLFAGIAVGVLAAGAIAWAVISPRTESVASPDAARDPATATPQQAPTSVVPAPNTASTIDAGSAEVAVTATASGKPTSTAPSARSTATTIATTTAAPTTTAAVTAVTTAQPTVTPTAPPCVLKDIDGTPLCPK